MVNKHIHTILVILHASFQNFLPTMLCCSSEQEPEPFYEHPDASENKALDHTLKQLL